MWNTYNMIIIFKVSCSFSNLEIFQTFSVISIGNVIILAHKCFVKGYKQIRSQLLQDSICHCAC